MRLRPSTGGFSLLEALISILILTTALWSMLSLYSRLLKGSRVSEERQVALVVAESLFIEYKEKVARDLWESIADLEEDGETFEVSGEENGLDYRIRAGSLTLDPFDEDGGTLDQRKLYVTVYYKEREGLGNYVELTGSVAR